MMNKKTLNLKNDKRAVSPVIGVILMVAITVILAAVIAAFVFGMGPPAAKASPAYSLTRVNTSGVSIVLHDMGGAMTVGGHYASGEGVTSGSSFSTEITGVGNVSWIATSTSPAHIIVRADVDGSPQVVIDAVM